MSKKVNAKCEKTDSGLAARVVDIFVFAVLLLLPLVVTNAYFNILPTKYYFFVGSVVVLVLALLGTAFMDYDKVEKYFQGFSWNRFLKRLSITDIALIMFLLVALLSTVTSDYVFESVWGNEGRYNGLFLLLLYGVAYFSVTRFGKMKKWYLDVFMVSGLLVCIFGIADYFKLDVLGFKENMIEAQRSMFTSTIGNINTYTALVGMVTAVSAVLFAAEHVSTRKRVFYYLCMTVSFFALIMGVSDNAYLSLAALFSFLPFLLFKTKNGVKSYLVISATFVSVVQCIDWINSTMGEQVLGIDSAFNIIINFGGLLWVMLGLWAIVGVWYGIDDRKKKAGAVVADFNTNWLPFVWLAFFLLAAGILSFAFYDATVNGNTERYGALGAYLTFNDDWGTHRGYIWRNAIECFEAFSPWKKLVGFGPDTFGILLLDKTSGNIYREIFDTAHNEYIQYLITLGAAGLISYLVFLGSSVVRNARKMADNKYAMAAVFGVVCYAVQAFVNLNLPISTPIMWMLLMVCELGYKEKNC